jgi:hypothetical protein
MNGDGQMLVDRIEKDVGRKGKGHRMERQRTLDGTVTNIRWNEWADNDCNNDG